MGKVYYLQCEMFTENKSPTILWTSDKKFELLFMLLCNSKRNRLIKGQQAKGLLSSLRLKKQLSKIAKISDILF